MRILIKVSFLFIIFLNGCIMYKSPVGGGFFTMRGYIMVDSHEGLGYNWNGLYYYVKVLDSSTADGTTKLEDNSGCSNPNCSSTLTDAADTVANAPPLFFYSGIAGLPPAGEITSIFIIKDIPEGVYDIHIFVDKNNNAYYKGYSYPTPDYDSDIQYRDRQYYFNDVEINSNTEFQVLNLTTNPGRKLGTTNSGIAGSNPGYWSDDSETSCDVNDPDDDDGYNEWYSNIYYKSGC